MRASEERNPTHLEKVEVLCEEIHLQRELIPYSPSAFMLTFGTNWRSSKSWLS
jgi:hypothetical protein